MSHARLADAIIRLEKHRNLNLPLRSRDLFGRFLLRLLWKRQLKGQVDFNLAVRDAVDALSQSGAGAARAATGEELEQLRAADQNIVAGLNQRLYAAIGGVRTEVTDLRLRLVDRETATDEVAERLDRIERKLADLDSAALDTRLRHAQLDLFLDRARATAPEVEVGAVPDRAANLEIPVAHLLDGPEDRVRAGREAYVPVVRATGGPVLDVSPSRGEWLEVLRAAQVPASGASANPFVVKHCAELGLPVTEADPLDVLERAGKRSLGAVTAFRFAERHDPAELSRFFDLAARSLKPGGVLVLETPDPDGGPVDFHVDPFARRPVHPTFLRFLAEVAGFSRVEVRYPDGGPLDGWPTTTPDRRPATAVTAATTDAARAGRYCLLAWV
ncbi:methyltransferase domain-containing protein [Actinosynnema sp. NPDC047251]|uniref:Methyltransferase type 11 domain-containing protein n=1 Tax=Saccharothrix espanaensis (strain ATCC 51144 / DSM 44229 / JCM 9112 / NBRC 15066 / NRRL 15764) TaxID=1179773 RepID=K0JNL6_SACES|nr:methyltransferase domain-containing protein [Saccharothrix espanaensis]CCH27400.1 hypothetical protein BN6_00680 [Saccharothrix espanaensis DSM 44229]